jgi:hypothetical protein
VAHHKYFALLEKPVSDARAPFVLPEYLKMVLSKNVMRNVARFRIRGHGLKRETGLYWVYIWPPEKGSPDKSARVRNLCKGMSKMRNTYFFLCGHQTFMAPVQPLILREREREREREIDR